MERTPTLLAALASAAVPGLDPVSVEALPSVPHQDYDVAFVSDSEHRRWVVRAPRSEAAGARMDLTVPLLQLIARRLPFAVPSPRGFVELREGGRAMVYPFLPGHNLAFDELPPGAGPAADLGRSLAALHNLDVRLFDEAGVPTYDTDAYRTRRLAELDRAAESGRVPTALLTRWEKALEDVALWRFAPTPTHGDLTGDQVLAVFEDDHDAATGRIRGLTGWEDAKVADPADDFAALVHEADEATVETVLEAYAHSRVERPDPNLLVRARLVGELGILGELMRAEARGDVAAVDALSTQLRRLDDEVHAEDPSDDYRRTSLTPVALRQRATPPPVVVEEDDDDELVDVTADDEYTDDETVEDESAEDDVLVADHDLEPDGEPDDDLQDDAFPDDHLRDNELQDDELTDVVEVSHEEVVPVSVDEDVPDPEGVPSRAEVPGHEKTADPEDLAESTSLDPQGAPDSANEPDPEDLTQDVPDDEAVTREIPIRPAAATPDVEEVEEVEDVEFTPRSFGRDDLTDEEPPRGER